MADEPQMVPLRAHRGKSVIPLIVGGLNTFVALILMGMAALAGVYLFVFQSLVPSWRASHEAVIQQKEQYIAELEKKYQEATSQAEKKSFRTQIEQEQKSLQVLRRFNPPKDADSTAQETEVSSFIPFTTGAILTFLLLSFWLFVVSIALFFRLRWSRKGFIAACAGLMAWNLVVIAAFLVTYNEVVLRALSSLFVQFTQSASPGLPDIMTQTWRRNLLFVEIFGGVVGLVYFSAMVYLAARPEVKADVERKPARDLMDWEHLSEGGTSVPYASTSPRREPGNTPPSEGTTRQESS